MQDFNGAQSIPRVITASPGGQLRFLPLPELTSLHTNHHTFHGSAGGSAANKTTVAAQTTNSYHLNVSFSTAACKYVDGNATTDSTGRGFGPRPGGSLYTGMIAPVVNYTIFGALW